MFAEPDWSGGLSLTHSVDATLQLIVFTDMKRPFHHKKQEIGLLGLSFVLRNPVLPDPFEELLLYYATARTTEFAMITLSRKSFGDK